MNVRALLLVAICLSALSAARAEEARTFQASVDVLTALQRDEMNGRSWHDVCPVPLDDLVSIHLKHVGFDGAVHDGVLVVHRRLAKETVEIFGELFAAGFPIERMQPYEDFPVGEYAAHNDTVGFYCRPAQDNPKVFSSHAYGVSVDINSMTNPYHDPRGWWPAGSNGDRNRSAPGLVTADSEAVKIFMRHGWMWGGLYNPPDYMHFSKVMEGDEDNPLQRPVWASQLQPAPK
jgi:D-alanyl-D-alanine carboxypeptidase